MNGRIKEILMGIYHKMFRFYPTFRINLFLINTGIEKIMAYYFRDFWVERRDNSKELIERNEFYKNNEERVNSNIDMLADEKSKYIYRSVIEYRCKKMKMKRDVYSLSDQYFVDGIISLNNNEKFIDCGAYVGDTCFRFFKIMKKRKQKGNAVAIEPVNENYTVLRKFFRANPNICFFLGGVSDKPDKASITGTGADAYLRKKECGNDIVEVMTLDSLYSCKDATYIKMDIEGDEWAALHGAEALIKRNHPKLAVCIYHSDEDMIRLIEYVHELNNDYKLYVRHHSRGVTETVLYAI